LTMPDLSRRAIIPEIMDTEPVPYDEFRDCLRAIERINRLTFAYRPTLRWLDRATTRRWNDRPIEILDVGSGHGDMLRRIHGWARRRGVAVRLTGIDVSPWATRAAGEATAPGLPIRYETGNVFHMEPGRDFDYVISSLFAHHLEDGDLVRFVRWMERHARLGWFVNDIHRHPVPYHFIRHAVRVAGMNRLVLHDAPASVARAFNRRDWQDLLSEAGLPAEAVEIRWYMPFKYGVGRLR